MSFDGGSGQVEAVLDRDGRIEHVTSSAEPAREELREAVRRIERAGRALRPRPDQALGSWRALVRGRWTLIDAFADGARRYIVARANAAFVPGPQALTPRERQAVSLLAMGNDYKLIAYELGVSHSTVRVLLARARDKLGAKSRVELVAKFRREE